MVWAEPFIVHVSWCWEHCKLCVYSLVSNDTDRAYGVGADPDLEWVAKFNSKILRQYHMVARIRDVDFEDFDVDP